MGVALLVVVHDRPVTASRVSHIIEAAPDHRLVFWFNDNFWGDWLCDWDFLLSSESELFDVGFRWHESCRNAVESFLLLVNPETIAL